MSAHSFTLPLFLCVNSRLRCSRPQAGLRGRPMQFAGSLRRPPQLKLMVSILDKKPSVFKNPQSGDVYYQMSDDSGPYAYATLNFTYPPVAILHVEVERFTRSTMKSLTKDDWPFCVDECRVNGCQMIFVNKEGDFESNSTWMKFIKHFGFKDFTQYTGSVQVIGD